MGRERSLLSAGIVAIVTAETADAGWFIL